MNLRFLFRKKWSEFYLQNKKIFNCDIEIIKLFLSFKYYIALKLVLNYLIKKKSVVYLENFLCFDKLKYFLV